MTAPLIGDTQVSLQELVDEWKQKLGLAEWQIWAELADLEGCSASATVIELHKQVVLKVDRRLPLSDWSHAVVHELTHLILWRLHTFSYYLMHQFSQREIDIYRTQWETEQETAINKLVALIIGEPNPKLPDAVWNGIAE